MCIVIQNVCIIRGREREREEYMHITMDAHAARVHTFIHPRCVKNTPRADIDTLQRGTSSFSFEPNPESQSARHGVHNRAYIIHSRCIPFQIYARFERGVGAKRDALQYICGIKKQIFLFYFACIRAIIQMHQHSKRPSRNFSKNREICSNQMDEWTNRY